MTRDEIETKIKFIERALANETDCSTIAALNRCLEKLIWMEASDE